MRTKSGIMLGLGETHEEVIETMEDLRSVGVDIITLGQYLQAAPKHLPVAEFVTPERLEEYKVRGIEMGFKHVESGLVVRSSYHAEKHICDMDLADHDYSCILMVKNCNWLIIIGRIVLYFYERINWC